MITKNSPLLLWQPKARTIQRLYEKQPCRRPMPYLARAIFLIHHSIFHFNIHMGHLSNDLERGFFEFWSDYK